jgi:hypothetical protein
LNLDGYDYEYNHKNDPESSSNPPTSVITPPIPQPSQLPVVALSNLPVEPRTTGPLTPVTPSIVLATPVTGTLSGLSPFVGGGMDHLHPPWPAPLAQGALHCSAPLTPCNKFCILRDHPCTRPTGLGTMVYWNIQAGMYTPGCSNVDRGFPCTIGHGCMPMVSPSPQ